MPFTNRLWGLSDSVRGTGMLSVVALGAIYGLAGFCSGPVLGAILTLAAIHTTSVIAGVLFVPIGVLFLRYDGTAGNTGVFGLGDTTDVELTAQAAITRWLGDIPVWAIALTITAVAAAVGLERARQGHDQPEADPRSRLRRL